MLFALGYIAGLVTSVFLAVVATFFKAPITKWTFPVVNAVSLAGPRPEGFIYEPPSEADEARERHIEENRKKGIDTPISELQ